MRLSQIFKRAILVTTCLLWLCWIVSFIAAIYVFSTPPPKGYSYHCKRYHIAENDIPNISYNIINEHIKLNHTKFGSINDSLLWVSKYIADSLLIADSCAQSGYYRLTNVVYNNEIIDIGTIQLSHNVISVPYQFEDKYTNSYFIIPEAIYNCVTYFDVIRAFETAILRDVAYSTCSSTYDLLLWNYNYLFPRWCYRLFVYIVSLTTLLIISDRMENKNHRDPSHQLTTNRYIK